MVVEETIHHAGDLIPPVTPSAKVFAAGALEEASWRPQPHRIFDSIIPPADPNIAIQLFQALKICAYLSCNQRRTLTGLSRLA